MSTTTTRKVKLRTVSDVLSRLRWDNSQHQQDDCMLGYDDRVHGPLESPVKDFIPISQGGDLPEHRIWYIRSGDQVLWDKLGRVDRVFGSGEGGAAEISTKCQQHIAEAQINMERLAREKEERRAEKAKQRRIKAMKRAKASPSFAATTTQAANVSSERFQWDERPAYEWSEDAWIPVDTTITRPVHHAKDLSFLTWNVLFDFFDNTNEDSTQERWANLVENLRTHHADVMALQEVTPSFVKILLSSDWVKKEFAASSSMVDTHTVAPHGNLLLWKRNMLSVDRIEVCTDGNRQRVILAILEDSVKTKYAIANVHLPANKGKQTRDVARQRELSSVLAELQRIESNQQIIPLILGDFNSGEENIINGNSFVDCWQIAHPDSPGLTFDPTNNELAARSLTLTGSSNLNAKRLDRIYVGSNATNIKNVDVSLVGTELPHCSDHYGVMATMPNVTIHPPCCLCQPSQLENAWASNAPVSKDSLLGLIMSQETMGDHNFFDTQSSLPIPHITLLHGFIEYNGCMDLLKRCLRDVLKATTRTIPTELSVCLTPESIQVFEHPSSATLVCCPDLTFEQNTWLRGLYQTARAIFLKCDQQESHSTDGWTPHISLGTFGTVAQARDAARRYSEELRGSLSIPMNNLAVFQRSSNDGKFYTRQVVPLQRVPPAITKCPASDFLTDCGQFWAESFRNASEPVLLELKRLAREIALEMEVIPYGSYALGASLPDLSDVDVAILVPAAKSEASFGIQLSDSIAQHFPNSKVRWRQAGHGKFQICTIQLWPGSTKVDAMIGGLLDNSSPAWQALQDTNALLETVGRSSRRKLFTDTLRIIKFWAHNRLIYGLGFLGGGGWAVWLAKVLQQHHEEEDLSPPSLAALFFHCAAHDVNEFPIHIALEQQQQQKISEETFIVLAPRSNENHARNSLPSCVATIQTEIKRAAQLVGWGEEDGDKGNDYYRKRLETVVSPINSLEDLESTIVISVKGPLHPDEQYSIQNYILTMTMALEQKVGDPTQIRPFLRPIFRKPSGWIWLIGVQTCCSKLRAFVQREESGLQCALPPTRTVTIECQTSDDTMASLGFIKER